MKMILSKHCVETRQYLQFEIPNIEANLSKMFKIILPTHLNRGLRKPILERMTLQNTINSTLLKLKAQKKL